MTRRRFGVIFGTRPEAIKLAPVIMQLERARAPVVKISTGQHKSMLWQALDFFGINADHDLGVMHDGQTLSTLLSRIVAEVDEVLARERPDVLIAHGDTMTALGAGLAASLRRIPVAHVEAGLRTFDEDQPHPEELNRVFLSRLARWHFCPTDGARDNLLKEGILAKRIWVTGNTIVDALHLALRKLGADPGRIVPLPLDALRGTTLPREALQRFVFVTSHRRENFGQGLANICVAIRELVRRRRDLSVVWPVHLNPQVRRTVERELASSPRVYRIEPVDYSSMLFLLSACLLILTDSGGIQEEAAVFHKPVLIMRKVTERPELVEAGGGLLVGTNTRTIVAAVGRLLDDPRVYSRMSRAPNPFGDGRAAERIVKALLKA